MQRYRNLFVQVALHEVVRRSLKESAEHAAAEVRIVLVGKDDLDPMTAGQSYLMGECLSRLADERQLIEVQEHVGDVAVVLLQGVGITRREANTSNTLADAVSLGHGGSAAQW